MRAWFIDTEADAPIAVRIHGRPANSTAAHVVDRHAAFAIVERGGWPRWEVWMDGVSIRSADDILRAVALGARGTLIGRSFLYGLGVPAGREGAAKALADPGQ